MSLAILSVVVAGLTCAVTVWLAVALLARHGKVRWSDLPFLFFVALAIIYLEISPSLAVVGRTLPGIALREVDYVRLQVVLFAAFVLPLVISYAWRQRGRVAAVWPPASADLRRFPWEFLLIVAGLLRLAVAWRYGLWRLRIGDDVAQKTGAAPFAAYSLFRLLVEGQLPLVTAGAMRLTRMRTLLASGSFGFFFLVQLLFALLNSRFSILYLLIAVVLGMAIGWRPELRLNRRARRAAAAALLGAYLMGVAVLQLRASSGDRSVSKGVSLNIVADNQGFNRFNCVDLLAQLEPFQTAPAGPTIWEGQLWNVRRFFDQAGFARFRESLVTTAKSQLILRYLGQRQSDYYSCMVTDGYGALGTLGIVALGTTCGLALRLGRRLLESGDIARVLCGVWLLWQLLVFEEEAGVLLFGWPLRLPVLVLLGVAGRRMRPRRPIFVATVDRTDVPSVTDGKHR